MKFKTIFLKQMFKTEPQKWYLLKLVQHLDLRVFLKGAYIYDSPVITVSSNLCFKIYILHVW